MTVLTPSRLGAYYGAAEGLYGQPSDWLSEIEAGRELNHALVRLNTDAWDLIEPSQGVFNWVQMDWLVNTLKGNGLVPVFTVPISAAWNRPVGENTRFPTTDYAAVKTFARTVATRYAGRIGYYEAWNEPDYDVFWGGDSDPSEYFEYLKAVYEGVKEGDPNGKVVMGGLAGPENPAFFAALLALGGGDYFDLANIHVYPALSTLTGALSTVRGLMGGHGLSKKVIVTETSSTGGAFETGDLTAEEHQKAVHLVKNLTQAMSDSDVEAVIWHTLRNPDGMDFGLMTAGFSKLPAFDAHQVFSTKIVWSNPLGLIQSFPGITGYAFQRAGGDFVYVVWGDGVAQRTLSSIIPGATWSDMFGAPVAGGTMIGTDPVYAAVV